MMASKCVWDLESSYHTDENSNKQGECIPILNIFEKHNWA